MTLVEILVVLGLIALGYASVAGLLSSRSSEDTLHWRESLTAFASRARMEALARHAECYLGIDPASSPLKLAVLVPQDDVVKAVMQTTLPKRVTLNQAHSQVGDNAPGRMVIKQDAAGTTFLVWAFDSKGCPVGGGGTIAFEQTGQAACRLVFDKEGLSEVN